MASRYFEEKYGIPHKKAVDFYRGPFLDCLVGEEDMLDVLPKYLEEWKWPKTTQDFVKEWFEFENKLNDELIEYIQKLREKGITCWMATNQEKHRTKHFLDELGFKDSLDGIFSAANMGSMKPDKRFFGYIIRRLSKIKPAEMLFWDDREENIIAARSAGINAEHYTNFNNFKNKMEKYLQ